MAQYHPLSVITLAWVAAAALCTALAYLDAPGAFDMWWPVIVFCCVWAVLCAALRLVLWALRRRRSW